MSGQRARAQELREQLDETGRAMQQAAGKAGRQEQAGRQEGAGRQEASAPKTPGDTGRSGQGQSGGGGTGTDLEKLREQYQQQLQQTKELADQMRRDDPAFARGGGGGFTFEAPTTAGLSAPGTEAFKQDFAKWEEMRRQATQVLEHVEASVSKKLQAKQAKDRLAAGTDDKAPPGYQQQVNDYFKGHEGVDEPVEFPTLEEIEYAGWRPDGQHVEI